MGTGFFVHRRIVSAVKRVEFVSDRLSYIVLRGRWHNIILVNVYAPSEEKSEESKDSFYEELEQVIYIYIYIYIHLHTSLRQVDRFTITYFFQFHYLSKYVT